MKICAACTPEASGMAHSYVEATSPTGGDIPDIRRDTQSNGVRDVPVAPDAAHDHRGLDPILSGVFAGPRRNLIPDSAARVRRWKHEKFRRRKDNTGRPAKGL